MMLTQLKPLLVEAVALALLLMVVVPYVATHLYRVYLGERTLLSLLLAKPELILRRLFPQFSHNMGTKEYITSLVVFSLACLVFLFVILKINGLSVPLALNLAISYVTSTNWQPYTPEAEISLVTQMIGLMTIQFIAPAIGFAALFAFARGMTSHEKIELGNFWVDLFRLVFHVFIPFSFIASLVLGINGVVQSLTSTIPIVDFNGAAKEIILGPLASQSSIALLGNNGGGYFSSGWSHPFMNPSHITHLFGIFLMLLLPISACFLWGKAVKDQRQGIAIFIVMSVLYISAAAIAVKTQLSAGHINGTESRISVAESTLWSVSTTATSTGATSMDMAQLTPAAQSTALFMILIGEVAYGGAGTGVLGMLVYVILGVFISGLMVGRSPEYLGKKITPPEMKWISLVLLIPLITVLLGVIVMINITPTPHLLDRLLYGVSSMTHNNGSALSIAEFMSNKGLITGALVMLIGRYAFLIPMLIIAGSFASKKITPVSSGTLPTHIPLFIGIVVGVILLIGALSYVPAITLGPLLPLLKGGI